MNSLMRASKQALQAAARSYASRSAGVEKNFTPRKVAILGAAGGIGQPLSLLMKVLAKKTWCLLFYLDW